MRTVLAIASARSAARPSQNRASAARVGTDDPRSTCGSGGATISGAARAPPSTHTSFARRADGRRGSSPGSSTRPLPPAITVTPWGPATACRRTTTLALTTWPDRNAGTPARTSSPRAEASIGAAPVSPSTAAAQYGARAGSSSTPEPWPLASTTPPSDEASASPGTPVLAGRDRVEHGVGQPAVDDVDGVEPAQRAQPQAPAPNDEVGTFHEVEPERPGERRVLDVGRILDPAGQQHDAGAADGGQGRQGVAQLGGEPTDRRQVTGALGPEELRRDAGHDGAVEQRVADARGRVGEVLDEAPRTVGAGDDIHGVRRQPTWRRRGADRGEAVAVARRQGLRRHPALTHGQPRSVEVGEQHLHRLHASGHGLGEPVEHLTVEHERHRVEPPRPVGRRSILGRPLVVDEVRGQGRRDHTIGFRLAAAERRAIVQEPLEQLPGEHHPTRR